jgi:dimethylhistidine N-methyltransferase
MSTPAIHFYDNHPTPASLMEEVLCGLAESAKRIPPKFFYDERGSKLFEAICELPEYYLTRTEIALLRRHSEAIARIVGPDCLLVELGSGASQKVRVLLEALRPPAYMPVDICQYQLRQAALALAREYPWLEIHSACLDYSESWELPYCPPHLRRVVFFPGSTVGNFEPEEAVTFLGRIARLIEPDGGLLIGVDLKKDPGVLNAAYDDSQGVTAAFNLNLLERINRELGANFDAAAFRHHAFYNAGVGRIEMHLVSLRRQQVTVGDCRFRFDVGETIHTENSYKYTTGEFRALAARAGLHPTQCWTDEQELFSIHYFTPAPVSLVTAQ